MTICSVSDRLLASSISISDSLEGAASVVDVIKNSCSASWTPRTSCACLHQLQGRRQSDRLYIPMGSALWTTRTSCACHCKLTYCFHRIAGSCLPTSGFLLHRSVSCLSTETSPDDLEPVNRNNSYLYPRTRNPTTASSFSLHRCDGLVSRCDILCLGHLLTTIPVADKYSTPKTSAHRRTP